MDIVRLGGGSMMIVVLFLVGKGQDLYLCDRLGV